MYLHAVVNPHAGYGVSVDLAMRAHVAKRVEGLSVGGGGEATGCSLIGSL